MTHGETSHISPSVIQSTGLLHIPQSHNATAALLHRNVGNHGWEGHLLASLLARLGAPAETRRGFWWGVALETKSGVCVMPQARETDCVNLPLNTEKQSEDEAHGWTLPSGGWGWELQLGGPTIVLSTQHGIMWLTSHSVLTCLRHIVHWLGLWSCSVHFEGLRGPGWGEKTGSIKSLVTLSHLHKELVVFWWVCDCEFQ